MYMRTSKSSSNNLKTEQINTAVKDTTTGLKIRVCGLVQGVGFRPTVWRLACDCRLSGEVRNDSKGVLIKAWGKPHELKKFTQLLKKKAPPLARIDSISCTALLAPAVSDEFRITKSQRSTVHTNVVPDAATCKTCIAEIHDAHNRRYGYAFTNCTHCGPRLTIIHDIPYDRCNTSMAEFTLCPSCLEEYENPEDRRFHAQPNACALCGPSIQLESSEIDTPLFASDAIIATQELLMQGEIVAIKGLGGFHLACDASNDNAVTRLRARKHRYLKAFALMAQDVNIIRRYSSVNTKEQFLLESPAAPIVILSADGVEQVSASVAPGQKRLGFMLPYTPLHHLLMKDLEQPIVLTSGNLSEEPQCIGNEEAKLKLSSIADYFLCHNREIINRMDDSVVHIIANEPRILRRARGYAPAPIPLPEGFEQTPSLLALGGELKNTFCMLKDGQAILSPHMGDLENAAMFLDYQKTLALYRNLYQHEPQILAIDQHPEYFSSKFGRDWAQRDGLALEEIQHHHAHIASCMAENGIPLSSKPVLGIALDGLGFGSDDTLWGGEFMLADYYSFERLAAFKPVAMLGSAQAIYEPWRNTYAHIQSAIGWRKCLSDYTTLELTEFLKTKPLSTLDQMVSKNLNSPLASSCGRLFDAVAAALGICRESAAYEGQAAIELEALIESHTLEQQTEGYSFLISDEETPGMNYSPHVWLDSVPMWQSLLTDLSSQTSRAVISAKFHIGLSQAIVEMVLRLSMQNGKRKFNTVALSGGVFQNKILFEQVLEGFRPHEFQVLTHRLVPANDGGLSLGQAVIAGARNIKHSLNN